MRIVSLCFGVLALASSVSAQYFSEGWEPGKPAAKGATGYTYEAAPTGGVSASGAAGSTPSQRPESTASVKSLFSLFSLESLLETAPIQALFGRAGVNITEKLEAARAHSSVWDERIPLITDENYEDLVVEEKFETLEEEKDRVWFIVVSLTSAQKEGVSKYVDEQFDKAYNLTQEAGDLPHVRWGRVDYMNVTRITTKWNVWRAPFLIVAKDRGRTLRFYRPGQIRLQGEILHEFLKQDAWEGSAPWQSAFGPGGSREFMMDYFATALTKVYDVTVMVPRWLLLLITGSLASALVNLMHNTKSLWSSSPAKPSSLSKAPETPAAPDTIPASANTQSPTKASGSKGSKGGASKRKGAKK